MKVCHVVYNEFPQDPRVRREVSVLASAGLEVHVLCTQASNEPRVEVWKGVRIERLPMEVRRGSRLRYVYQYAVFALLVVAALFRNQLKHHYRVVHVHSLPDFLILGAIPSRLSGARLVLDLHESSPELLLARFGATKSRVALGPLLFLQRLSCVVATHVITVNARLVRLLTERGVPSARITIVENAPDWESTRNTPEIASSGGGTPQVIIAGGLNRERDYGLVIKAAARVLQQHRFRLRIVGHGTESYRNELKLLISELGMEHAVSIEDTVSHDTVPSLIRATCFGIVSYERNPLTELATPNKAYEYAACGKPMVVANLPGLRILLGDSALYYEPGDVNDLAEKMTFMLDHPAERQRLGTAAAGVYVQHQWPIMAERLREVYRALLHRREITSSGRRELRIEGPHGG